MTPRGDAARWAVLAGAAMLLLALCVFAGQVLSSRRTPDAVTATHAAMFIVALTVWLAALQAPKRNLGPIILALAVAARLALLAYPPSDDLNRYIWEGRLVLAGESPYAQPASAAEDAWRDDVWAGMNNRDRLTAYPPGAQLLFAAAVAIAYDPVPLKLLFLAADIGILAVVLRELRRRRRPEAHLALLACNPVMLLGIAGEGHFDTLFVLPLLLALRARCEHRPASAWAWLAAAVQLKIMAVLLVPLFCRDRGWRRAWAAVPVAVLPSLPFLADLPNLVLGVVGFGAETAYHGFADGLLSRVGVEGAVARGALLAALAAWTLVVTARVTDPWRAAFFVFGGLLLLSPVFHFWYLTWLLPFLPLWPQPAWLLLSGSTALYHQAWVAPLVGGPWGAADWTWWGLWLPFAVVLLLSAWPTARRLLAARRFEERWPQPSDISAIIPAVNEAKRVAACIAALRAEGSPIREIIVVDGGSDDETVDCAARAGAVVLRSARGRGYQIHAGVAAARADVIWIVHADLTPAPGTAAAIVAALRAAPEAAGGAAGQRFRACVPLLTLIEWLNAARSALFGLSFGDQGQFFRRAALPALGGYPRLPLMEDVEVSLRLRRVGPTLHLGCNGVVSTRRWARSRPGHRIWMVVRLTALYLVSRDRRRLSERLYRTYYPVNDR